MRNPDSLSLGEPGCRANPERRHPNRPFTHFASGVLFRAAADVQLCRDSDGRASGPLDAALGIIMGRVAP